MNNWRVRRANIRNITHIRIICSKSTTSNLSSPPEACPLLLPLPQQPNTPATSQRWAQTSRKTNGRSLTPPQAPNYRHARAPCPFGRLWQRRLLKNSAAVPFSVFHNYKQCQPTSGCTISSMMPMVTLCIETNPIAINSTRVSS